MKNTITVVTVCFNAEIFIESTMLSVLNQTYMDLEYIIIDGASKDNTLEKVREIASRFPMRNVRIFSEPDKGIYDAMNKGIERATGKWINFMNAGDTFYNDQVLDSLNKVIDDNVTFCAGHTAVEMDSILYKVKCDPFYEHLPLHRSMGWCHQSSFVKASFAKKNKFDLRYKLAADYNMAISSYRQGNKFQIVDMIIAKYDLSGVSHKHKRLHTFETLEIDNPNSKILNLVKSYIIAYSCALRDSIKPFFIRLFPKLAEKLRQNTNNREIIRG